MIWTARATAFSRVISIAWNYGQIGGTIAIMPHEESYLNLSQATQVTLRIDTTFRMFDLENAAAALREGRLAILAERLREVEPELGPAEVIGTHSGATTFSIGSVACGSRNGRGQRRERRAAVAYA